MKIIKESHSTHSAENASVLSAESVDEDKQIHTFIAAICTPWLASITGYTKPTGMAVNSDCQHLEH